MRELSAEERSALQQTNSRLDAVKVEIPEVLADFLLRLGLIPTDSVVVNVARFLRPLDGWMQHQVVSDVDRDWVATRIAYVIGEFLRQRLRGEWLVCERPDSRYFGRIVVGRFELVSNTEAIADPFEAAVWLVSQPPGRSLSHLTEEIEDSLANL